MEHVVFYPAPDGSPAFARAEGLEAAVQTVEHLRNVEGITEVSVFALTEVPLAFRPYYRVELPGAVAEQLAPDQPAAEPVPELAPAPAPGQAPALELVPALQDSATVEDADHVEDTEVEDTEVVDTELEDTGVVDNEADDVEAPALPPAENIVPVARTEQSAAVGSNGRGDGARGLGFFGS